MAPLAPMLDYFTSFRFFPPYRGRNHVRYERCAFFLHPHLPRLLWPSGWCGSGDTQPCDSWVFRLRPAKRSLSSSRIASPLFAGLKRLEQQQDMFEVSHSEQCVCVLPSRLLCSYTLNLWSGHHPVSWEISKRLRTPEYQYRFTGKIFWQTLRLIFKLFYCKNW